VRSHKPKAPTVQSRHLRPRQWAQARAPRTHLWGQSATLTSRPGRSPLRGCRPHMQRAQTRSVDAHEETKYPQTWRGTPSPHPTHTSRAEVTGQRPTRGQFNCDSTMAVDWRATSGRASLTIESGHTAAMHRGKGHHGLAAPRHTHPSTLIPTPFRAPRRLCDHAQPPPPPSSIHRERAHLPSPLPHGQHMGGRCAHQPCLSGGLSQLRCGI
jgi:hypothetical protein